jgi:hypothetical protein
VQLKVVFPPARMWDAILSQKYSGNITIVPPVAFTDFFRLVDNPSPDDLRRCAKVGERATWPSMHIQLLIFLNI